MEISVIVQIALQRGNRVSIGRSNFLHVSQAESQKLGDHWPHRKLCLSISVISNIWKEIFTPISGCRANSVANQIGDESKMAQSRATTGWHRHTNLHFSRGSSFYFLISISFVRLSEDRAHPFEVRFLCRVFISKLRVLPFPFSWSVIPNHNGPVLFARPNLSERLSVRWRTFACRRLCVIFDITPMLHEEFPVNFFTVMCVCVLPWSNKSTSARQ